MHTVGKYVHTTVHGEEKVTLLPSKVSIPAACSEGQTWIWPLQLAPDSFSLHTNWVRSA